jgi:hypothetical protein
MAWSINSEKDREVIASIELIRKNLLVVDGLMKGINEDWLEREYLDVRKAIIGSQMKLVEVIQKLDKINLTVTFEERISSGGFRPNVLGGNGRVVEKKKSLTGIDGLIIDVLRGNVNVKGIAEATKPKEARNE